MSTHFFIPTEAHVSVVIVVTGIPFGNLLFEKLPKLSSLRIQSLFRILLLFPFVTPSRVGPSLTLRVLLLFLP